MSDADLDTNDWNGFHLQQATPSRQHRKPIHQKQPPRRPAGPPHFHKHRRTLLTTRCLPNNQPAPPIALPAPCPPFLSFHRHHNPNPRSPSPAQPSPAQQPTALLSPSTSSLPCFLPSLPPSFHPPLSSSCPAQPYQPPSLPKAPHRPRSKPLKPETRRLEAQGHTLHRLRLKYPLSGKEMGMEWDGRCAYDDGGGCGL